MLEYQRTFGDRVMSSQFVKYVTLYKYIKLFSTKFAQYKDAVLDMEIKIKSAYRMWYHLSMNFRKEGPTLQIRLKRKINK